MRATRRHRIALVTAPDVRRARALARAALAARLAACVQLVPRLESHYWWQGRIEVAREVLMVFKTTTSKLEALERIILEQHPYETAQFVVVPIIQGSSRYLDWLDASIRRRGRKPG